MSINLVDLYLFSKSTEPLRGNLLESAEFLLLRVHADPCYRGFPSPAPSFFEASTLIWALQEARLIVLWVDQCDPADPATLDARLADHLVPGGSIAFVTCGRDAGDEWLAHISRVPGALGRLFVLRDPAAPLERDFA